MFATIICFEPYVAPILKGKNSISVCYFNISRKLAWELMQSSSFETITTLRNLLESSYSTNSWRKKNIFNAIFESYDCIHIYANLLIVHMVTKHSDGGA